MDKIKTFILRDELITINLTKTYGGVSKIEDSYRGDLDFSIVEAVDFDVDVTYGGFREVLKHISEPQDVKIQLYSVSFVYTLRSPRNDKQNQYRGYFTVDEIMKHKDNIDEAIIFGVEKKLEYMINQWGYKAEIK